LLAQSARTVLAQEPPSGTLLVVVRSADGPVASADVQAGGAKAVTGADGTVSLRLPAGRIDVIVTRDGFDPAAAPVDVPAGSDARLDIAMVPQSEIAETVIVSATRTERRIEDEPLRVEVVPEEEVQEKIVMTPGDVSMLLAETNGLRVQTTSPALGGASVRIQGLNGRYTQVLADGLPLYGGQSGSASILQIPPMDLAQVEVIKGVASALYGMSAIGGVVNLVSRRPRAGAPEREVLLNQTSHRGTDAALWIAQSLDDRWGVSLLGGTHFQNRSDLDDDGWTDLPMYRRLQARPRVYWDNGSGRSILMALGAMSEQRRGGTMMGATAPDGAPHPENLDTTRFDGGLVGRFLIPGGRVLAVRASSMTQRHEHTFGSVTEGTRSRTWFGETSLTGTSGRHTWVGGAALQRDAFSSPEVPRFDYTHTVPGVFGQDDYAVTPRLTLSASGRLDVHSEFGTFFSPKLSALLRPGANLTFRVSGGRGHFAPVPFTEETEAAGLSPLAPLGALEPEHGDSLAGDVTWSRAPLEITTTLFYSRIENALTYRELEAGPYAARIVNAGQPTETRGTEFIARFHEDELDVILTHMFVWSTEAGEAGDGQREVPLNPRHTASLDILWRFGSSQLGIETFYTGTQALEDNPYRTRGRAYVLFGFLFMHRVGPALLYVNTENLGDVRQTKDDPLLRPAPLRDGRWSVDAWAPLDGRTLNAGLRFRF
ncbi:MAG TPA: TonB-dependent receptor, partial [Vicinamibacterales bacterium]